MKIGFIGSGAMARAIARRARAAGHTLMISNSRGPQTLAEHARELHCAAGTSAKAAAFGDVLILSIPLKAIHLLDPGLFAGKIVLDSCNYYPTRDGRIPELDQGSITTSEIVARQLPQARIVKAFNSIMQGDLERDARPLGAPDRRALPIAGDDAPAKSVAARLTDEMGFDPVDAGSLADSWRFERAMPAYCMWLNREQLRSELAAARRGVEVPHDAWKQASLARSQAQLAGDAPNDQGKPSGR